MHAAWYGLAGYAMFIVGILNCSGSGDGSGASAQEKFENNVFPLLQSTCGSASVQASGCHLSGQYGAPKYLATTARASYSQIEGTPGLIAAPSASPLVQHGLHAGPALSSLQESAVVDWLNEEVKERGLLVGVVPAATNPRDAFTQFAACMTYQRWLELGLDKIASTPTQASGGNEDSPCTACHSTGHAATRLDANDPYGTFYSFTQFPNVERLVEATVNAAGQYNGLVPARRLILNGVEARTYTLANHAAYELPDPLPANIDQYVNEVLLLAATGQPCAPASDAGADAMPQTPPGN